MINSDPVSSAPPNSEATLSSLIVFRARPLVLIPPFNPNVFHYTSVVDRTVNAFSIRAVPSQPDAIVTVNGLVLTSESSQFKLSSTDLTQPLDTQVVPVVVLAQDGVTNNTYSIEITRSGSTTVSSLSTGFPFTSESPGERLSEISVLAKVNSIPTPTSFNQTASSQTAPYTVLVNQDSDLITCVDGVGCDVVFVSIQGKSTHRFVASDTAGNDIPFERQMLAVCDITMVPGDMAFS